MSTRAYTVAVGWTKSDPATGYSPFSDGYRPGADQHTEIFVLNIEQTASGTMFMEERIAEAVYAATNDPSVTVNDGTLEGQVKEAIDATGYRGEGYHYSLSVGDTVTVGSLMLAVEPTGFNVVEKVS